MFDATINFHNGDIANVSMPTIDALYFLIFSLNENVTVCGKLVKARNGKHPDYPNSYFCCYTREGLAALYKKA